MIIAVRFAVDILAWSEFAVTTIRYDNERLENCILIVAQSGQMNSSDVDVGNYKQSIGGF
jgi:hypothetical protein